MNNYSMHDELAELQGKDLPSHNWYQSSQDHSNLLFSDQVALNSYTNDFSHMLRGLDGKVHTEYQEDTMVNIGGVDMTYGTAVRCGFIEDDSIETHEYAEEKAEFGVNKVPDIAPMPTELAGQVMYAINAAGDYCYEDALMGDAHSVKVIAQRAGASIEDTKALVEASMGHYINAGLRCAADLLGAKANLGHVKDYYVSSAVTPAERRTLLRTVRRGDISGVYGLVERYKAHYGL